MELYSCGFNGHGQLDRPCDPADISPVDIYSFQKVITSSSIKVLFAGWSSLVVQTECGIQVLGYRHATIPSSLPNFKSTYGTHDGPLGILTYSGQLYAMEETEDTKLSLALRLLSYKDSPKISNLAITSAGRTALTIETSHDSHTAQILEFDSFDAFLTWFENPVSPGCPEPSRYMIPGVPTQLTAYATGFVVLMQSGDVYTWGDPRYSVCLGRSVTAEHPADRPGMVEALGGIRIAKIASGGWMNGALSEDMALYLWGRIPPSASENKMRLLEGQGEEVHLVSLPGELDIIDVGIGVGHIVVLADDGKAFVMGENGNGQLGLGPDGKTFAEDWIEVNIPLQNPKKVVQVGCGDFCTFTILEM